MTHFLFDYAKIVNEWIEEYLKNKEEPWVVYRLIKEFLGLGGKRFRPALTLITTEMYGKDYSFGIRPAVAIELFHNFTLIHDDIEDNSEMRRGIPCLHKRYNIPLAINAGDGLFILVWDILCDMPYEHTTNSMVQREMVETFRKVLEGQGIELSWIREKRWDITEEDYEKMVYGKTAALIETAVGIGGVICTRNSSEIKCLKEFGRHIGIGFQIQDDILNIIGDFDRYKKEIGGDISEGKRTLMTIHAIENLKNTEKEKLISILEENTKDEKKINEAIELLKKSGSIEYAKKKAQHHIDAAIEIAHTCFPDNEHRKKLLEIAEYMVKRDA